jgi:N-dimethylarginine dimethylaminohydrolase
MFPWSKIKIHSTNEWSPLKSVVVGDALGAYKPDGLHFEEPGGYRNDILAQATMDLDRLVRTLQQEKVKVYRPEQHDFTWTGGMYNYCPRDRLLVIGDTVLDCNMQYPMRNAESKYLDFVLKDAKRVLTVPRNKGIFFDAANVCRLDNTLLYLQSVSGNRKGARWLQAAFPNHTVEVTKTYGGVHIDRTFSPVADGLVVVNKDRVTKKKLPKCFKDWEVIWLGDEDLTQKSFSGEAFASNYILLNFFMIRPDLAVIDDCPKLEQALRANGVLSYTVPFAHSRTLGGGHHCATLDLHRS